MENSENGRENTYKMRYSVATNFDTRLIDEISKYNKQKNFISVFGKLRSDILGGGRTSMVLPNISVNQLKEYIQVCHKNNLQFNYLLNPACTGNREIEASSHKKIIEFISNLIEYGVDSVTVNSPYLCEVIKKQFPSLKVTIGLYADIYNINRVKYWINLGADELTLYHSINRNFQVLENILTYAKKYTVSLRLIANNVCLHSCPYEKLHGNVNSHASRSGDSSKNSPIDYCMLKCVSEKIKNPSALLSSEWIRPEDIAYYEELCNKTGNHNFSIKLLERTKNTEFIMKVIKAYATRSYDGNLLDILAWPRSEEVVGIHKGSFAKKIVTGLYNVREVKKYLGTHDLPNIYVDNKKLDGFLDKFISKYECDKKLCDSVNYSNLEEHSLEKNNFTCSYCRSWVNKAITFDEKEVNDWVTESEEVQEGLRESKIFSMFG